MNIDIRNLSKWLNEEQETPIDRQALARVLAMAEQSAQPSKPLMDEQIEQCMKQAYSTVQGRNLELAFARAIESAHGITKE